MAGRYPRQPYSYSVPSPIVCSKIPAHARKLYILVAKNCTVGVTPQDVKHQHACTLAVQEPLADTVCV
jgi:hypothetical protein